MPLPAMHVTSHTSSLRKSKLFPKEVHNRIRDNLRLKQSTGRHVPNNHGRSQPPPEPPECNRDDLPDTWFHFPLRHKHGNHFLRRNTYRLNYEPGE